MNQSMLRYNFRLYPTNSVSDPSKATGKKVLANQGYAGSKDVVAFFTDARTQEAVTSAPPILRLFLEKAGFELSDAAPDVATPEDALSPKDLRRQLAEQLSAALSNRALKKALFRAADQTDFDVATFISVVVAKTTPEADFAEQTRTVVPRKPQPSRTLGRRSRPR